MKQSLLGTGLSGLVGSKFVDMFSDRYEFSNLDLSSGVDITDAESVKKAFESNSAEVVAHFAAFTDVNKANEEKGNKEGLTYKVNVVGTRNIAQACKEFGKHLIHISTAYVFDGEKEGLYVETDNINPIEWYGQTKAWAEEEVDKILPTATILRIDQPYRDDEFPKLDILHRVKKGLEEGTLPPMFIDHTFTPTKIETFSSILHQLAQQKNSGVFHATTEPVFTDYKFALWVQKKFSLPGEVKPGSLKEYLERTQRPYQKNTALNVEKLREVVEF